MKTNRTLKQIEQDIEATHETFKQLEQEKTEKLQKKKILCHSCKKKTELGKLTYEEVLNIDQEGEYYHLESEFTCPKCSIRNRLVFRPEIRQLKSYFENIDYVKYEDVYHKKFVN